MRTRLAAILACLLIGLLAAHGTAHAAIGACGSDPVVTFADGQSIAITPEADTTEIAHVTDIYLSVTSNSANPPVSTSGQSANEHVTRHSSSNVSGWQVQMVIDTDDGSSLSDQFTVTYRGTTYPSPLGTLNSIFWVSLFGTF